MLPEGLEGIMFSLASRDPLEQEHNFAVCLMVLPKSTVLWNSGIIAFEKPSSSERPELRNTSSMVAPFVGISGGPEAVKRTLCEMVDNLWEAALHAND